MPQLKTNSKLRGFWKKIVAILTDQINMFESYEKLFKIHEVKEEFKNEIDKIESHICLESCV